MSIIPVSIASKSKIIILLMFVVLVVGCTPQEPPFPTVIPTTALSPDIQAEQTLYTYYSALKSRDYDLAASLFYSESGIGKSDLIRLWNDNDASGWRIIGFEIVDSQHFDENRIIYFIQIKQDGLEPQQYSTINVLHFDGNQWLVSNALLDKIELNLRPKTQNQITIIPGILLRSVSGIEIWINITNNSNQSVIWGDNGKTCARLFGDNFTSNFPCLPSGVVIEPGQARDVQLIFAVNALEYPNLPKELEISLLRLFENSHDTWGVRFELETVVP